MSKLKNLGAAFVALFLLIGVSFGADKYVRVSATGGATGADWNNAWSMANLNSNMGSLAAGTNVWIAGGTYTTPLISQATGSSGSTINFKRVLSSDAVPVAAPGWSAGFDATVAWSASTSGPLEFRSGSYVVLDGRITGGMTYTIAHAGGYAFNVTDSTHSIANCTVQYLSIIGPYNSLANPSTSQAVYGFNWVGVSSSTVTNCLIQFCSVVGTCEAIRSNNWNGVTIDHCYIADTANDGLDHEDVGYTYGTSSNVTWSNNTINNSPNDGVFHEFGGCVNFKFFNNVYYNSNLMMMDFKDDYNPPTQNTHDNYGPITITNNIFHCTTNGSQSGFITNGASNGPPVTLSTFTAPCLVENNIFFNVANSLSGTTNITSDYNGYNYTSINGFPWPSSETHSFTFTGNPFVFVPSATQPVGSTGSNFQIVSTAQSTFKNKGLAQSVGSTDPNGNARGSQWDVGVFFIPAAGAQTYYVDIVNGSDSNPGTSPGAGNAFATITKFATTVGSNAPDAVCIVYPGLYPPMGTLNISGSAGHPLIIKSTQRPTAATMASLTTPVCPIISGANNANPNSNGFRNGVGITWTSTGSNIGGFGLIYSSPCAWIPAKCEVLSTATTQPIDLYPYQSLSDLQNTRISSATVAAGAYPTGYSSGTNPNGVTYPTYIPGPHGGYFADGTTIYVRLDSQWCSSQVPSNASNKMIIGSTTSFFGIAFQGAYVLIDGFGFEGCGNAMVTIKSANTIVQNCFFQCGVPFAIENTTLANNTVQNCEFSSFPCFQDAAQAYTDYLALNPGGIYVPAQQFQDPAKHTVPWSNYGIGWAHKLPTATNYERSCVHNFGLNCVFQNNYCHDQEDTLGAFAVSLSTNLLVKNNFIARCADNALEYESQSVNCQFVGNVVKDAFEAISYQPQTATIPGPCTTAGNVIFDSQDWTTFWRNIWTAAGLERCVFKIQCASAYLGPLTSVTIPGGWSIQNNTIAMQYGDLFHWQTTVSNAPIGPIAFYNNFVSQVYATEQNVRETATVPAYTNWNGISFFNNAIAPPWQFGPGVTNQVAGSKGIQLYSFSQAMFTQPVATPYDFTPLNGSQLNMRGVSSYTNPNVPAPVNINSCAGAIPIGGTMPALGTGVQPGAL